MRPHSSSLGSVGGAGAPADVAADPLGVWACEPGVRAAAVIQQDAMGGADKQVAAVGQAAVLAAAASSSPVWWRWETRTLARLLKGCLVAAALAV
jgi:hypothetical protein